MPAAPSIPAPLPTVRADLMSRLDTTTPYDLAVVGGGATGLGVALDAAARGLRVVLFESHDFAKGTSSRATKLVHGGVRYLAQGNIGLVREALRERTTLLRNAPHLAQPLPFVVPAYRWWERPFYGAGLTAYDVLAGRARLGRTEFLSAARTLERLPGLQPVGLRGGVQYWDGQFDDARLAIALARTSAAAGALVLNYCSVEALRHDANGKVAGVVVHDTETGQRHAVQARCVVNATGVWADGLRRLDASAAGHETVASLSPSQGVHLVVDREFLGGHHALMVPHTADGRVLFAVPWLGKVILGTTDTPRADIVREPEPLHEEVAFILREAGRYLRRAPQAADVRSAWVGLRPLVRPADPADGGSPTRSLSREHTIAVAASGLVTVTGGKWTTYRAMAEDVLGRCADAGLLPAHRAGATLALRMVGAPAHIEDATVSQPFGAAAQPPAPGLGAQSGLHLYGTEAAVVAALPGADRQLADGLTEAMVRFAVRHEYARTVEDVLARRARLLFLDARQAFALAEPVAQLLREEGVVDPAPDALRALAQQYARLPIALGA